MQSFLNSRWDLRTDKTEIFVDGDALADWLATRGLLRADCDLAAGDLARALSIREGLRQLAFENNGHRLDQAAIAELRSASAGARTEIRIEPDGPHYVADTDAGLDGAIGALFAIVGRAMVDGSWRRLKACPGRHCGWVFYDESRNQSARWCSMSVCGDREKSRAYYRRQTRRR